MHLLLVRHGQSFVNLDDWDQGNIDVGLTPLGHQQAAGLAKWMAVNVQVDVIYTSTMVRTLETAAYLADATGLDAQPDDRLREFGNCYRDGVAIPAEKMPIHYPDFWGTERPYTTISSTGESWTLFRARVGSFMDDVVERHGKDDPEKAVVVICHGGVIDAMFDTIFNVGINRQVEIMSHNTGVVHWEYHNDRPGREPWRLHAHGLVQHLTECESGKWLGSRALLRDASRKSVGGGGPAEEESE